MLNIVLNQSMKWNLKGIRKGGLQKSTWKRENQDQLKKKRSTKLSVKPHQLLLPKKNSKALCVAYALLRDKWQ